MQEFEKPGAFYLGRRRNQATGETTGEPLIYDSRDLTTHAVCVGMTGSGKTGLCLSLLEEAALDGVPAIAVDPKGDLGNLLLTFPKLRGEDFRPWLDEAAATRAGVSVDELAEQTAERWRTGLAKWNEDGDRIARFEQAVERTIYTPGSSAGIPLSVLKSFSAPPQAVREDGDALVDRVESSVSGLLTLVGLDADPVSSPEHILLSRILNGAWSEGRDLDLAQLVFAVQKPGFSKIGAVDLDNFLSPRQRDALAMRLNNLLASPSFASWTAGEPLDIQRLLYTAEGKPRLSILSIGHLSDSERMFFVTILLNELVSWVRAQPGTSELRAIFYMDEVFGFFPPSSMPPAKRPMLTLLKQARAFGVGCVLATQNPVDLDYKGLSNAGTWFLGRLQTERDKQRVIEGLQGAQAQAGESLDAAKMDALLSGLASRVFLMNNVHAPPPKAFETRWALSYLAGPLTRAQIARLMAQRKEGKEFKVRHGDERTTEAEQSLGFERSPSGTLRPMIPSDVVERFWPVKKQPVEPTEWTRIAYRPALLGSAQLHYIDSATKLDCWQQVTIRKLIDDNVRKPVWDGAEAVETTPILAESPVSGAVFYDFPGELAQAKNYSGWKGDLKDWLYQTQRYNQWYCAELGRRSEPGQSEADFREAAAPLVREAARSRCEAAYAPRIQRSKDELAKAESRARSHRWWWVGALGFIVWRALEILIVQLLGSRSRKQLITNASSAQAWRGQREYSDAKAEVEAQRESLTALEEERRKALEKIDSDTQPATLALEEMQTPPRKGDLIIDDVILAWVPWRERAGASEAAY